MHKLLRYLYDNRKRLTSEVVKQYKETNTGNSKIDIDTASKLGAWSIDALCEILQKEDPTAILPILEKKLKSENPEDSLIAEAQKILFSARNVILTDLGQDRQSDAFIEIVLYVNKAFDSIIFYLFTYIQEVQGIRCKHQAKELERQVQRRTSELEESRSNYKILFEKINDGCFVNQSGKIVFANKAFCQMHAYERDEIIGMECKNLISDDSRDMVMARFYQHLKGDNCFDTFIYCRKDKNGNKIPTENRIKLIKYQGKPAVLGLSTDITHRIEMEEKIKQKDRLALIGRLTTSIAHEIRNPLSAIKVNVEILQENLKLEGNDQRRLQIALEQSLLLENILSDTIRFAKPIQLNYSLADLSKVIDRATEIFEEQIKSSGISVKREVDSDVDYIMIDRERIIEAVSNVFKNALEAFDDEMTSNRRVKIMAQSLIVNDKRHIRLSVVDNGKGIAKKDRKNIFEPFVTKGKKGGVGLGLPIVKRIVDAHNGYFDIESIVGEGTSFSFIIPAEITQ